MKKFKIALLVLFLQLNITAEAALITLATGQVAQTTARQSFSFDFNELPSSDGTGGILILKARGDYTANIVDEFINLKVDQSELGSYNLSNASASINHGPNDNEWTKILDVGDFFLTRWLSDGNINLWVNLGAAVSLDFNPAAAYVDVTLTYNTLTAVPIPPAMYLFATGLLLLLGMRQMNTQRI